MMCEIERKENIQSIKLATADFRTWRENWEREESRMGSQGKERDWKRGGGRRVVEEGGERKGREKGKEEEGRWEKEWVREQSGGVRIWEWGGGIIG